MESAKKVVAGAAAAEPAMERASILAVFGSAAQVIKGLKSIWAEARR